MRNFTFKNRYAFTMIELVMVIVVLGILAPLAMPRLDRDLKQAAADSILSSIRYTQHLALVDDMHERNNPKWQQKFWKIMFAECNNDSGFTYRIGSNKTMSNGGTFKKKEAAIDPINGKPIYGTNSNCGSPATNPNVLLGKKYGISSIDTTHCGNHSHIGFDHLGRPHQGFGASTSPNYASYMSTQCILKFGLTSGEDFNISIQPETGYAHIGGQDDS